ncbi:hypothetical protein [Vibrio owensii]|uniref:hypothetical protein n=1 Tax=Vibrio owensii TaxID=696485 RepID=UPI003CC6DC96
MNNNIYKESMQDWANKFGDLITWKTRPGQPINQMYRILGLSRNSHMDYLNGNTEVPAYVLTEVEFFNKLRVFDQHMIALNKLGDSELSLKEATDLLIEGWESLVGKKLAGEQNFVEFAGQFSVRNANKQLKAVIEEDDTGLAAALLIRKYADEYVQGKSFSYKELVNGSGASNNLMASYAKIQAALSTDSLGSAVKAFINNSEKAIEFYLPHGEVAAKEAAAEKSIELFLNAKKSFKGFSKYTISKGRVAPNTSLKLQEQIFVFNTIEDLVERSVDMPNGFALSLIRTSRYADSFFCMTIKHDGMIYLIADKSSYGNPLTQDFMASRNQRYNEQRLENTYMPYDMLNIVFSDKGRVAEAGSTELALSDDKLKVLGHIKSMSAEQILWFTFLLEEAKVHFMGVETPKHKALGYFSSESLEHPLLLEHSPKAETKNLPSTYVAKGGIKVCKAKKVSRKLLESHSPSIAKTSYANQWMEDMFDSQVEEQHLYIPSDVYQKEGDTLLLGNADKKEVPQLSKVNTTGMDYFATSKIEDQVLKLKTLPSTMFGSTEEIQKQADYIARYNKAETIEKLVKRDFEQNESKIQDWIAKKIAANMPNLIDDIISLNHQRFFILHRIDEMDAEGLVPINDDMMRQVHAKRLTYEERLVCRIRTPVPSPMARALKVRRKNESMSRCFLNKTSEAEYRFKLQVSNVYDLMNLTGIPRDKMPKQLQNWGLKSSREYGPLDKGFDPMQDVRNPWNTMRVTCVIPISKEALSNKRKELGIKGRFTPPKNYYDSNVVRREFDEMFKEYPEFKKYHEHRSAMPRNSYDSYTPSFAYSWAE